MTTIRKTNIASDARIKDLIESGNPTGASTVSNSKTPVIDTATVRAGLFPITQSGNRTYTNAALFKEVTSEPRAADAHPDQIMTLAMDAFAQGARAALHISEPVAESPIEEPEISAHELMAGLAGEGDRAVGVGSLFMDMLKMAKDSEIA
ncbi:MAG: hypothetical protein HQM16_00865 [Deltaproteobacteria bacterium]|nr:hypothetical protein [Deltaproteobacteria bacterium]